MKYSSIESPSRKLLLMGRGIMSPRGLATRPRMPAIWRTCIMFPRAPEPTIMSMGLNCLEERAASLASRTRPVAVEIGKASGRGRVGHDVLTLVGADTLTQKNI